MTKALLKQIIESLDRDANRCNALYMKFNLIASGSKDRELVEAATAAINATKEYAQTVENAARALLKRLQELNE